MHKRATIFGLDPFSDPTCEIYPVQLDRSPRSRRRSRMVDNDATKSNQDLSSQDFIKNLWSSINDDYETINKKYCAEKNVPNRVINPRLRSYHNFKHAPSFNKQFLQQQRNRQTNLKGSQETLDVPAKNKDAQKRFDLQQSSASPRRERVAPTQNYHDESLDVPLPQLDGKVRTDFGLPRASNGVDLFGDRRLSPFLRSRNQVIHIRRRVHSEYKAVVAIDIGCSGTNFVFTTAEGGDRIYNGVSRSKKLQTCLLLDENNRFFAFGDTAIDLFSKMDVNEAKRYAFFKNIVERLADRNIGRFLRIKSVNGTSRPAVEVLTHCLRYLKTLALTTIENVSKIALRSVDVQWVLSVPNIWDQSALQLLRSAAVKAGLATCDQPAQLKFVSSIEGLATFVVQNTALLKRLQHDGGVLPLQFRKDDAFIVMDCGSFKYEATVFRLDQDGISEVCQQRSELIGPGGLVQAFEGLLHHSLGSPDVQHFKSENAAAYEQLLNSFTRALEKYWVMSATSLEIPVPHGLTEYFRHNVGHSLRCSTRRSNSLMEWNPQGYLKLPAVQLQKLHESLIGKVLFTIGRLLANSISTQIKAIVLGGGFSNSLFLQESLLKAYGTRYSIYIVPELTKSAVSEGSALAALHPGYIKCRMANTTIGVGVMRRWDSTEYPEHKRVVRNDREWCADVFDALVTANQLVSADESVVRFYAPSTLDQTEIVIQLLRTRRNRATFVTEDHIEHLGVLRVALKGVSGRREVKVTFLVGHPELMVKAESKLTGMPLQTHIDFLATSVSTML